MSDIEDPGWQGLYKQAVMESDPQDMQMRIDMARRAIRIRMDQYREQDSMHREERTRLDSALYFLNLLNNIIEQEPTRRCTARQREMGI